MPKTLFLFISLFISVNTFGQNTAPNPTPSNNQSKDSLSKGDFYFSLDIKNNKLLVPSNNDGFKIYGIKIFNAKGTELISTLIDPAANPNSIDISMLPDGDYIVHLVTADQAIYKTKMVLKR